MRGFLLWSAVALASAIGLIGALHTPVARSMLGDWCPFGARGEAPTAEARRAAARAWMAGDGVAAARPSAGFALGVTTREDLTAAAARDGMRCRPGLDRDGLACDGGGRHVAADFAADGTLVALSRLRYFDDAGSAQAVLGAEVRDLVDAVGAPTRRSGPGAIAAAPLRQERVVFRRANYYAAVSATNLGARRFVVSEVFRAL